MDCVFVTIALSDKAVRQSGDRVITYCIKKAEPAAWPQLLKDSKKQPWLKTDFNRWKDLDESDSDGEGGFGGFGGSNGGDFQNMLNMMGGNKDFEDDDGNDADADSDDEGKIIYHNYTL
uniref:CS domain-containing protein n=1 Tax=Mesocestoides corti TaxID=53468 RepID=A0A5K3EN31_MESCO